MYVLQANRLVYPRKNVSGRMWDLPHEELGDSVAYTYTDELVFQLRELTGAQIPWPIESKYEFQHPPGKTPRAHQIHTAAHCVGQTRCFVWNGIGTGKTASALWGMDYLFKTRRIKKALILTTKTTVDDVWLPQPRMWTPELRPVPLMGSRDKRLKLLQQNHAVYVMSHDSLRVHMYSLDEQKKIAQGEMRRDPLNDLFMLQDWDLIVVDEHTVFRNHDTDRTECIQMLCKPAHRRVWMMSGSPRPKAPTDLYTVGKIISPDTWPRYFTHFRDMTMRKVSNFKWVEKGDANAVVTKLLGSKVIRYERKDCIDIPETETIDRHVPMTKVEAKLATHLTNEAHLAMESGHITVANAATLIGKLLQVHSGGVKYIKTSHGIGVKLVPTNKYEFLSDVVDSTDGPVIVYAAFRHTVDMLRKWADDNDHPHTWLDGRVTGGPERRARFNLLREGKVKLLIAHPKTMAHGVTLTESNTIVWWTVTDDADIYDQANGRITREGQTRTPLVIHLAAGPQEMSVINSVARKLGKQQALVDMVAAASQKAA